MLWLNSRRKEVCHFEHRFPFVRVTLIAGQVFQGGTLSHGNYYYCRGHRYSALVS
jgi:hypothetical protein